MANRRFVLTLTEPARGLGKQNSRTEGERMERLYEGVPINQRTPVVSQ